MTNARFQVIVLCLLLAIVGELAAIALKLPTPTAQAQGQSKPVPVVIVDPGSLISDCIPFRECARVDPNGVLRVSVVR